MVDHHQVEIAEHHPNPGYVTGLVASLSLSPSPLSSLMHTKLDGLSRTLMRYFSR